jgi:hypothetical protein
MCAKGAKPDNFLLDYDPAGGGLPRKTGEMKLQVPDVNRG